MKGRFLVIGSNSFSGAQFVKYLIQSGNEVIGVSRSAELNSVFLPYKWNPGGSKFVFFQIDLNHQLDELLDVINQYKPAYIINFAAQGMVAQSWETPQDWYQTNVVGQV